MTISAAKFKQGSLVCLAALIICANASFAQSTVVAAEYFIDEDPGPGFGNPITGFSTGVAIDINNFAFPTNGFGLGWHTVHVRTKDANGVWGFYESRRFFIRDAVVPPQPPDPVTPIVAMEYFYDNVGEPGTGVPIAVTNGLTVDVTNETLPQSLSQGWHTLHVRTKNQNNTWGFYDSRKVFVRGAIDPIVPTPPVSPIVAMEYFYDDVTAPGTGTAITITPGFNPEVVNEVLPNALIEGWHTVHVRPKNQDGTWGFYDSRKIFIRSAVVNPPADLPSPIVLFEYFLDSDPGVGLSPFTITKPPATLIDLVDELIDVGTPTLGAHKIGIRAKNGNNVWGLTEMASFTVAPACPISTAPAANNAIRCDSGTLTLIATGATGPQVYRWYINNTTYSVLFTGPTYITPVLTANTNYFVSLYNPTTFCESARTQVTAIVTGIPKPVLNLNGSLSICEGNSVSLVAPGGFTSYAWSNGQTTPSITASTSGNYTVIVGDGTCFSPASDPFVLTINPKPTKPTISATGGGSLCGTGLVTLTASAATSYSWSTGATTASIDVTSVGNFTVQVKNGNGCESIPSDAFSVTSSTISKPVITVGGNPAICEGSEVQLSGPVGFASYLWSNGATTSTILVNSAGSYSLVVSNGSCTSPSSDPVNVTVLSVPLKPDIVVTGNTEQCIGDFTVLSAPVGYTNYLWSNGETTRQIVVNAPASFTVQVGNSATCLSVASDPKVITFTGLPCGTTNSPPAPTVGDVSRCDAGSVTFTASGATGSQIYRWYDAPTAGTLLSTGASYSPSVSVTTTFYVLIYDPSTTLSGNRAAAKASIATIPAPVITGPSTISICEGSSTLLSAPLGNVSYLWSNGATSQQIQLSTAGSYSVQVGDGTCQSLSSNTITVSIVPAIAKPLISITGNATLCGSSTVQLSAPVGSYTYNWSNGATSPSITTSIAGNYSVTISNGTCTSPTSDPVAVTSVTILPKPTINTTGNQVLCSGGGFAVLTATLSPFYLWSTGETTRQIVVATAGNYTVQVGNATNCLSVLSDATVITISGIPCNGGGDVPPAAPATFTQVSCAPGTFTLAGTGANVNQEYRWYSALTGGSPLFIGQNFNTGFLSTTTGYYLAIRDLSTGLESSRTLVYASVIIINKPVVNPSGSISTCSGNNVLLSGPAGFTQYIWTNTSGNQVGSNQIFSATVSGNYFLEVSNGTCTSPKSDGVTVSVSPVPTKPVIQVISGNTTFCGAGSVELRAPSGFLYTWSTGATTQSITLTESAVITLTIRTGTGCVSPVSDPVVVTKLIPPCKPNTPPLIEPIILSVNIEGSVTVDLLKYIIDGEDNLDYTRIQTLTPTTGKGAAVTIDGSYNLTIDYKGILYSGADRVTLEAYDLFNQKAQRIIEIDVVGEVIVFNGITADGDKINDFLYIQYLDVIQGGLKNKVTILNRWGDTVFEMDDYNNIDRVFSGAGNNGTLLPPGTYFYRIDLSNRKPITGFITLKL